MRLSDNSTQTQVILARVSELLTECDELITERRDVLQQHATTVEEQELVNHADVMLALFSSARVYMSTFNEIPIEYLSSINSMLKQPGVKQTLRWFRFREPGMILKMLYTVFNDVSPIVEWLDEHWDIQTEDHDEVLDIWSDFPEITQLVQNAITRESLRYLRSDN